MDLVDLFPIVVTFVAIGVLLSFGLNVQSTIQHTGTFGYATVGSPGCNSTTEAGCGFEFNASRSAIQANNSLASNLPILGTITIAAIVIGVLIKSFVLR